MLSFFNLSLPEFIYISDGTTHLMLSIFKCIMQNYFRNSILNSRRIVFLAVSENNVTTFRIGAKWNEMNSLEGKL